MFSDVLSKYCIVDANSNPIIKIEESEFTSDIVNKHGLWFWAIPEKSDNIDTMKFAINMTSKNPSWVINNQSEILTPTLWTSDEFTL